MMWLTTMNPETRRLIKVLPTDVQPRPRCLTCCWAIIWQGRKELHCGARR